MAQFEQLSTGNIYSTIEDNGVILPQEPNVNFIGSQFTIADDPGSNRTNITFPNYVLQAGDTMTGLLILSGDPVVALGAVTKQYADSIASGLSPRTSCRVGTTAALTVTYANGASGVGATLTNAGTQAALSIDGVALAVTNRVLVKDQASTFQNGIYVVSNIGSGATNWVLTRATDYDAPASNEVAEGSYTIVTFGTVNATNMFVETGLGPFTIGTTPIVFTAFNSAAGITAGTGLTKVGNTISLTNPVLPSLGGTGVANLDARTITLGGAISTAAAFSTSGANALTLTTTGSTNVTLPTTGTLVNTAVTTLSSLASIGTITTGVWNGTLIGSTYGGTGVNNGTKTLTLGGNLATSGAFNSTFTMTADTTVTFPTTGTLATTSQIPSTPISLANGGTGASLTASNGGIFYSNATTGAILSGTATANQVLLSGASTTPAWSTATYPATTTINQLLYSSSANVIAGLTTGNNGALITSAGGIPSISSTLPNAVQTNITATGALAAGSLATGFTAVTVPLGGTGLTSCAQGDLFYGSASNTISALAKNTSATRYLSNTGTTNNPAWAQIDLSNGVTGILPVANGGTAVAASDPVIQRVSTTVSTSATGTTTIPFDNTIPQNTEGDQYMSLAITPKNTANILVIDVNIIVANSAAVQISVALFQDSTAGALSATSQGSNSTNYTNNIRFRHSMTAGTTSATTFKVRAGPATAGTITFNGNSGTQIFNGVAASGITITEYAT